MIRIITFITFITFILAMPAQALAATLKLVPATGTANRGCLFPVNIELDTGGAQTDGTDAILRFDPTRLTTQTSDIQPGSIYSDYPGTNVDPTGKITISGLASVSQAFSGKGTLATINFTVPQTAPTGLTQVSFEFDPNDKANTTDSNVVQRETIADVLSSVTDGSYTIGTGVCSQSATGIGTGTGTGLGQGQAFISTPSVQPKTIDQVVDRSGAGPGTPQLTFTITIVGAILTVLGVLGLALL